MGVALPEGADHADILAGDDVDCGRRGVGTGEVGKNSGRRPATDAVTEAAPGQNQSVMLCRDSGECFEIGRAAQFHTHSGGVDSGSPVVDNKVERVGAGDEAGAEREWVA